MRRTIIPLILLAFAMQTRVIAKPNDCIKIHFKAGNNIIIPTEKAPKIMFENGIIAIDTERYQFSNISKYTFEDSETLGIEYVETGDDVKNFAFDGQTVHITLADKQTQIHLYTVGGLEIPVKTRMTGNGLLSIDMSTLGADVYLLQIGNETLKIKKQ